VIVCHTWGVPAPMAEILGAARDLGILVIEDASHCHGATYAGRFLGTLGDIGCFSLQGTKALVAGEGGVLVTNDRSMLERAMIPGHHPARLQEALTLPQHAGFVRAGGGWKYRANPLAMAIAAAQLPDLTSGTLLNWKTTPDSKPACGGSRSSASPICRRTVPEGSTARRVGMDSMRERCRGDVPGGAGRRGRRSFHRL